MNRPSRQGVSRLAEIEFWIFDLDGTLTEPAHDFDAIRDRLGLPQGRPILEQIAEMDAVASAPLLAALDRIERDIALDARARSGAHDFLASLSQRGCTLGILTRNSHANALATLTTCDLARFFDPAHILGRESCAPKPSPDGILKLLSLWATTPGRAVMVGDYRFDVVSGRRAGTLTVSLDPHAEHEWSAQADVTVNSLDDLRELATG